MESAEPDLLGWFSMANVWINQHLHQVYPIAIKFPVACIRRSPECLATLGQPLQPSRAADTSRL